MVSGERNANILSLILYTAGEFFPHYSARAFDTPIFATMDAMDREQAWSILCEFTKSDSLRRHALAVEACVTAYARKFNEDETKWSVTALLHDFDYEIHPDAPDHPMKGEPMLAERGVDAEIRRAILSHANYSGVSRDSTLEKTLFACDELAGFLTACSYVKRSEEHTSELQS